MKVIALSRGMSTLVDDDDFELLNKLSWYAVDGGAGNFYAVHSYWVGDKSYKLKMHRLIMNAPKGAEVDHKDGNTLNNSRLNLRLGTHAENMRNYGLPKHNTSGVVGVQKSQGKWVATRQHQGKLISFGRFDTVEEASLARTEGMKNLGQSEFVRGS